MKNKRKHFYRSQKNTLHSTTSISQEKPDVFEIQKERCRQKIHQYKNHVILQSTLAIFAIGTVLCAFKKKNIVIPIIATPTATYALSKLAIHETKRRWFKDRLDFLEKE